jgi:hypothetical protein
MAFFSKEKDIVSLLSTVVIADVAANQVNTFEHIVPIDLSSIFRGYGPLPAVTATQNQLEFRLKNTFTKGSISKVRD